LKSFLNSKGIQTMIHYPKALPFAPAYKHLKHEELHFPVAASFEKTVLSLPVYPELSNKQVEYVCEMIKSFYES
jgi:dTDP-4-amino-4,6-dideoxygalactose transaminase